MTPEGRVKKKIDEWLKRVFPTAFSYKPVSMGYGKHGIPDYILCVPKVITADMVGQTVGLFVGVEAKSESGTPTDLQLACMNTIMDASGIVEVVAGTGERFNRAIQSLEDQLK